MTMVIKLYNAGVTPFYVEQNGIKQLTKPCETQFLKFENEECLFKLIHLNNHKFNSLWYLLNDLFTLEQMRTVLVVDGDYCIKPSSNNMLVKVKDHEYVFDKNTSYETFVFNLPKEQVHRKHLKVENANVIIRKAKFLYLFGGNKTLLPLVGIALLMSIIKTLFTSTIPNWNLMLIMLLAICFVILFVKYKNALKFLFEAIREDSILTYMKSSRKEYRKFSDDVIQNQLDINAGKEIYW